jgi:AraC family ethanolamine operon transcriptional activator
MEVSYFNKPRPSAIQNAIIAKLDQLFDALPPSSPLYNSVLARHIGTPVRTLQAASVSVTGLSIQRYLRFKRLSQARCQLSKGILSVKAVALANGFWHLGDFARVYTQAFGELPSQTQSLSD